MIIKKYLKTTALLTLCGGLWFAACQTDDGDPAPTPSLTDDNAPGVSGTAALATRDGGWEKGGVDAVSSASILRVGRGTFGYVDKVGSGYNVKLVNVDDPTKTVREKEVPDGKNVALWTTGDAGKIILFTADETGYEAFTGHQIVVFDKDLRVIKKVPAGNASGGAVEPLHHRDPGLAVTDKYAIAAWEEDVSAGAGAPYTTNNISIYALNSDKVGHILVRTFSSSGSGPGAVITEIEPGLGVGNLTAIAAHGDYIIVGGGTGTKVYKINDSGETFTFDSVGEAQTPGAHWMLDNQNYVLEPTAGNGKVRVWKWNGSSAPTVVGTANVGATTGNVQAVSFDNEDTGKAYVFGRVAASNVGEVYSVNLTTAAATKRFKIPSYQGGGALAGIWTIQVEQSGSDTYYILGGTVAGITDDTAHPNRNGVLVVKNPATSGSDIDDSTVVAAKSLLSADTTNAAYFPTAIRTMKAFKTSGGDIIYAAKNYTAGGANFASSDYKLRLIKVND